MLTSKQRASLRAIANGEDTIIQVGKGGITESVVTQALAALKAREIIKCRVLENSLLTAKEACDELCRLCNAEPVQVIGTRFVLYKMNRENPKIKLGK